MEGLSKMRREMEEAQQSPIHPVSFLPARITMNCRNFDSIKNMKEPNLGSD